MARQVSLGRSVKVTVPTGQSVEQDKFYLINGFFGLAGQSAAAGEQVVLNIEQAVYETTQINTSDAFNFGDQVYWDAENNVFTTDAAADANGNPANRPVGRVVQAKDADNVVWILLGPQVQAHA